MVIANDIGVSRKYELTFAFYIGNIGKRNAARNGSIINPINGKLNSQAPNKLPRQTGNALLNGDRRVDYMMHAVTWLARSADGLVNDSLPA